MRVYKEKQFLIFEFDNGKSVKYDFATKTAIGIKGNPVKNLNSQLSFLTLNELIECCDDPNYADFLKFIRNTEKYNITNIGTLLKKVPYYARYEQIFSAGYHKYINSHDLRCLKCGINNIPKGLIKLCKTQEIQLTNKLIESYISNPNKYHVALNENFENLTKTNLLNLLEYKTSRKVYYGARAWEYSYEYFNAIDILITDYGYNLKSLLHYIDDLYTFEAMESPKDTLRELTDYIVMMEEISPRFEKYPKHFLTTHKIACRNYNRLKQQFKENDFASRINKDYEYVYKDYKFIYPSCIQDIKDEAVAQSNCVASYIDRVIQGQCHIMFLRKLNDPKNSLVTLEIRDNRIVQAKRRFNYSVTAAEQEAIDAWNKKYNMEVAA